MPDQDNENQNQPDGTIFTDSWQGAMQFTPGTFLVLNGEWHKVIRAEENPDQEGERFRVLIKKEEPPQGTAPFVQFVITDENGETD